jgi:hypothetical protein
VLGSGDAGGTGRLTTIGLLAEVGVLGGLPAEAGRTLVVDGAEPVDANPVQLVVGLDLTRARGRSREPETSFWPPSWRTRWSRSASPSPWRPWRKIPTADERRGPGTGEIDARLLVQLHLDVGDTLTGGCRARSCATCGRPAPPSRRVSRPDCREASGWARSSGPPGL